MPDEPMHWECHACGHQHPNLPERCARCGTAPEVVLNRWRCAHCGEAEIPGTAGECPACRAPKGLGVESRVDAASLVAGEQGLALARGRWLYCAFCDVQVPPLGESGAPNTDCPNCSGPLTEATQETASRSLAAAEAAVYRKDEARRIGTGAPPPPAPAPRRSRAPWIALGVVLLLGLGVYLVFFHGWSKELSVTERRWQRTVEVERLGPVAEEGWAREVPAGARERSCRQKVHHTDRVAAGQESYTAREAAGRECAEQGYKTQGGVSVKQCLRWQTKYREVTRTRTRYREVPVMASFCRYTVEKWHRARELVAQGGDRDPPAWPDIAGLAQGERAGKRRESYTLALKHKDRTLTHECAGEPEWKQFKVGGAVRAEMTTSGKIKRLAPAN